MSQAATMSQDYGLWPLVVLDSAVMIIFAVSFFHPRSRRDWRAMGALIAGVTLARPTASAASDGVPCQ